MNPMRALVIDDHPLIHEIMPAVLRKALGEVAVATETTLEAGLSRAAGAVQPDLVLLDLGLPGMGGLEVCRRLRADPSTTTLPIVMLTGRDDPRDARDGLLAGANAFITKPFSEIELLAVVKQFTRG